MPKRFNSYIFSIKSSLTNKPMALLLLIIVATIAVVACGYFTRGIADTVEYDMYSSVGFRYNNESPDKVDIQAYGDYLIDLRNKGLTKEKSEAHINSSLYNVLVSVNDGERIKVSLDINYAVYGNGLISDEDIASGKPYIEISEYNAQLLGCDVGDKIDIVGNIYEIHAINEEAGFSNVIIPYTVPITKNIKYIFEPQPPFSTSSIEENSCTVSGASIKWIERLPNKAEKEMAAATGLKYVEKNLFSVLVMIYLVELLIVSIVAVLNILYILSYVDKVNSKKYAIMNIVGARPRFTALAMLIETMAFVLLGLGVGLLIDWGINESLQVYENADKLLWIHYVIAVILTFVIALAAVGIRIRRRIKAVPIDRRIM